jgi:pilus assembly protein CpaE
MSPNSPMVEELDPLLQSHVKAVSFSRLKSYPTPPDLPGAIGGGAPHLVFLDVFSDRDQAVVLIEEMVKLGPQVQVIALLGGNDPDLVLRCLRAGAVDFLIQPFSGEQIEGALSKLARLHTTSDNAGKEPAKVFVVMPAKGACGATTVACNLAFQCKRLGFKRVLLADLDPLTGNISFLLKIKSIYSFLDAIQRAHELDMDLWNAMVTEINGVDVLIAPELLLEGAQDLRDSSPILEYARHIYDVIIIDTNGVYSEWNLTIARMASELLLVTTNELPALQAAQRALSYLDTNRIGRWKIRLLVNRYLRDVGLNREVIGTALHIDVFETVPSDYDAVQKALLDGKPIPSNTSFGKSILQLADRLSGRAEKTNKSSSLGGLLGLFSRTSK